MKEGMIMRDLEENYVTVATHCSEYSPISASSATNSATDCDCKKKSCEKCAHFVEHHHCNLDLYDKIEEQYC